MGLTHSHATARAPESATGPATVFDEATSARPLGDGRYAVRPDERFAHGGAVNGGVLIASILRAVLDTSPHPYPVATSVHFLRVARPEPAEVHVTWLKEGKTAATARAALVQDGTPVIETVVTTGAPDPHDSDAGISWTGEPPHLPPVELTWHMRGVPVPGLLRVAARCRRVSGGWFDEEAEVWDAAGHLVAQSRQLARVGRSAR